MRRLLASLVVLAGLVTGCTSASKDAANGDVPAFTLKLRTEAKDNRYTYFEIDRKGDLLYGGGRLGAQRTGDSLGPLTPEQRREVWRIITDNRLLQADSHTFAEADEIRYELTVNTGLLGKTVRTVDERTPGMKELHDYLFERQADVRFNLPGLKQ